MSDWPADANNSDCREEEQVNQSDCRADERVTPNPFDNYSVRRKKKHFCINSDNMKQRFYYTFFDEMELNNF